MRSTTALLCIIIAVIIAAGCTGTQELASPTEPVTPSPSPSLPPSTPVQTPTTPVPTPISQGSVSDNTVAIRDFGFLPQTITVQKDSTVRWLNEDTVPHRIIFTDAEGRDTAVESSVLSSSQSYSRRFTVPGTYNYYCKIHAEKGSVIVV